MWDVLLVDANTSGSVGEALQSILGLLHQNSMVDNTIYDSNGILTSGRVRVFATNTAALAATDGGIGEGEILEFAIDGVAEIADPTKVATHRLVVV